VSSTDRQPPGADATPAASASEALLAAMPHGRLSREQVHGANCIWCAVELTDETATDLWPRSDEAAAALSWSPRGCRACTEPRATMLGTYHAWLAHVRDYCASCIGAVPCEVADALRAPLLEALGRIGQAAIRCASCCEVIDTADERFEPLVWEGMSAPVHGYRHAIDCTSEAALGVDDDEH
jgi:hypothetical protein